MIIFVICTDIRTYAKPVSKPKSSGIAVNKVELHLEKKWRQEFIPNFESKQRNSTNGQDVFTHLVEKDLSIEACPSRKKSVKIPLLMIALKSSSRLTQLKVSVFKKNLFCDGKLLFLELEILIRFLSLSSILIPICKRSSLSSVLLNYVNFISV